MIFISRPKKLYLIKNQNKHIFNNTYMIIKDSSVYTKNWLLIQNKKMKTGHTKTEI